MSIKPDLLKITASTCFMLMSQQAMADRPDREVFKKMEEYRIQYEASGVYKNSMYYQVQQAFEYSQKGDSINASLCLQKVSPYYFIERWHSNERPDTMLSNFAFTENDKKAFIKSYMAALGAPKSATYNIFKKMTDEDEAIKKSFVENADTITNMKLAERRWNTDQAHFQYLYDYVQKNGWPKLEDGAEYALEVAVKDEKHREYYLHYALDSTTKGVANMNGMRFMLDPAMPYDMTSISYALGVHSYSSQIINIKSNGELPDEKAIEELKKYVRNVDQDGRPHKMYYLFVAPNKEDMENWLKVKNPKMPGLMEQLQTELSKASSKLIADTKSWNLVYTPGNSKELIVVFTPH